MLRWLIDGDEVRLGMLTVGPLDNNVYIVACPETRQAVIVDAASDERAIMASASNLRPSAILTTHGHWDHVGAVEPLRSELKIQFRMHGADAEIAEREPDAALTDGETIPVGKVDLTAIHTPGHTPGSMCFAGPGFLLTGDTLFPGGPGATRFPYSSFDLIMESLTDRLFVFPDGTRVFPGHGASTSIGQERPHLEHWRIRGW